MLSDHARRDLYVALESQLGPGPADSLMELLPPVGWADVARQGDLVAVRGEIAEVRGEIAEVRGEIAEVRGEIALVRGEVSELRGEVRAQLPRLITANIGSMVGIAGLVFAVAKLA
jgi:hypothetical protein